MRSNNLEMVAVAALAVAVLGSGVDVLTRPTVVRAGDGERFSVEGIVKAVDVEKRAITVTVRQERQTEDRTFEVAPDAKVAIAARGPSSLKNLEQGMHVALALGKDDKTVIAVRARRGDAGDGPVLGSIKTLDIANNTLTLTVRGNPETFTLNKDVRVAVPGKESATLRDLQGGMRVALLMSGNGATVAAVRVVPNDEPSRRLAPSGILKAVDVGRSLVIVTVGRGIEAKDLTFTVDEKAPVAIGRNAQATLADLKEGMRVSLLLAPDRQTVIGILAQSEAREGGGKQ